MLILSALATSISAHADIYRYEAPDGTLHFTDCPTDKRFKVFMKDIKKDRKLRTAFRIPGFARNPAEFEPIITSCSREFGVDISLIKAVIHVWPDELLNQEPQ